MAGKSQQAPPASAVQKESAKFMAETLSGRDALEPYRDRLEELASKALEPNPFYEPWMLFPAMELLDDARFCSFVLVFREDAAARELTGFFPVMTRRFYRGLPVRHYTLLQHKYCFLTVPLLDRDLSKETLECFFGHCRVHSIGLVDFGVVPVTGLFHQVMTDIAFYGNMLARPEIRYTRPVYQTGSSPAEYLSSALSGKGRWRIGTALIGTRELRRKWNRLNEAGLVEYCVLDPGNVPEAWLREFLEVEASGWKGARGTAMASSEAARDYFMQVCLEGLRHGRVSGSALRLDGRMIAGRVLFIGGEGSFVFKIGFREEYARYSPGPLVEVQTIEHGLPECVKWTDSCTSPRSNLHRAIWKDLLTIESLLVAPGGSWGELVFGIIPVAQALRRFWRKWRNRLGTGSVSG